MRYLEDDQGRLCAPPVHGFFGLSYSSYFVMPRSALQAMPLAWQERFVALMEEADKLGLETPSYHVLRDDDAYTRVTKYDDEDDGSADHEFTVLQEDQWANYRHADDSLLPLFLRPILPEQPSGNANLARHGSFRTTVTEE